MNQAIKKFIRDYLRLLFICGTPWFSEFLPRVEFGAEGFLLFGALFIVFSLFVLNWSIKLVRIFGKESINSLFYAVPLSAFYMPYVMFIISVGSEMSNYGYYFIKEDFSEFFYRANISGLYYLIIFFIIMFTLYYKLRD